MTFDLISFLSKAPAKRWGTKQRVKCRLRCHRLSINFRRRLDRRSSSLVFCHPAVWRLFSAIP